MHTQFKEQEIEPGLISGNPRTLLEAPPDFIDLLPVAAYACDAAGRILWFNRRAAALWGRAPRLGDDSERFCGSWKLYFGGRQISHAETPMATTLRTGEAFDGAEGLVERPDGSQVWTTIHIDPVKNAAGEVLGAINCFHDTTELHQARMAVVERDARTRQLLDAMPAAVYTTDATGRITYYNRTAVALAGREPVLGSDKWCVTAKLYWPDGTPLPHDACPMALALKEKRPNSGMEAIAERPDGTRVPFLPYPTPLFDASGTLTGAVNMLVDISKRKQAEQSLVENEQRLAAELAATQHLQHISTELVAEQDAQGIHANLLDAAVAIMHADFASIQVLHPERGEHGELQLLGFRGFTPEAARFWEWVRIDSACTCGIALGTGKRVITADVTRCDFMVGTEDLKTYLQTGIRAVQTTPLVSRSGRVLGMISTHWREPHEPSQADLQRLDVLARQAADLLDRAKNETALRHTEAESQRQRRLYEAILTNTPDLVCIFGHDHRFIYANETMLKMLGKRRDETLGKRCLELGCPAWNEAIHDREIEQVIATKRPIRGEVSFNVSFVRRTYDYIFVPVIGPDGTVEAVAATARNITKQKISQQRALAQKQILEKVATGRPFLETLDALMHFLEAQEPGMRCGILLVDDDGAHFRRGSGPTLPEQYHKTLDGVPITPPYLGACSEAAHRGVTVECPDLENDTRYADSWRTLLLSHGIRATRSTPVFGATGRPLASIAMYFDSLRDPAPDPELFAIATHLAAIAIEHHQAANAARAHAQHRELLLNELNHRVKNTLATVQSMAMQTLRNSSNAVEAGEQIESRLLAMSKAHEILTREHWEGARLENIIQDAIAPYCSTQQRFELDGPNIWVSPRYALSLAMALHELCTNAVKYGALSNEAGRVRIEWEVADATHGTSSIKLRWIERDGPPVDPPSRRGFGSRLVERGLRQDLRGTVKLEFARSGVVCTVTAPLPSTTADRGPKQ